MLVGSRVFANMMSSVLPEDMVNEIVSFHGTEYDKYRHRYTWDEIDEMVYELMTTGPDFCCYLFSILSEIGDDLYIFYPNAKDDPKVMRKTGWMLVTLMSFTRMEKRVYRLTDLIGLWQTSSRAKEKDGICVTRTLITTVWSL